MPHAHLADEDVVHASIERRNREQRAALLIRSAYIDLDKPDVDEFLDRCRVVVRVDIADAEHRDYIGKHRQPDVVDLGNRIRRAHRGRVIF